MSKPRLLDLFCGAGGCTKGYQRAGFYVVGVDNRPQPNYCGDEFVQADALAVLRDECACTELHFVNRCLACRVNVGGFDAIHASPPCQAYSALRSAQGDREYPDLVAPVRDLLQATGLPYVIENVPGAPLDHSVELCGSMFGLCSGTRQLRRHRLFETSFAMLQPTCEHRGEALGVYGGGPAIRANSLGRRGGYQGLVAEKAEAMGINWMTAKELNQAIPPAYTELIGHQLMQHILAPSPLTDRVGT